MSPEVDDDAFRRGAAYLKAMAHPLRLAVLTELTDGPRCVHELVDATGATQPLVSQHLRVLRSADLLVAERRGREVVYSIVDSHIHHIVLDAVEHAASEGTQHEHHVHDAH
ncbi:MAG: metalloregulator ArsR/SmtB family transcription factor [Actinomycetota bacterium]